MSRLARQRGPRQHHRQIERRRPRARHRSARRPRCGRRVTMLTLRSSMPCRRSVAARRSRSSQRVRASRGAAPTPRAHASRADVNLMLEHVWLQYLSTAPINVAVPNPEWFDRHDRRFLADIDSVWAKTSYTRELFRALGCSTTYIGFDSEDRYDAAIAKQRTYFHLAGKSTMKGTDRLLRVWQRHPEWPQPDPRAAPGRRRAAAPPRTEYRRARRLPVGRGAAHAAERKCVSSLSVADRRLGALHRRGDGSRRA